MKKTAKIRLSCILSAASLVLGFSAVNANAGDTSSDYMERYRAYSDAFMDGATMEEMAEYDAFLDTLNEDQLAEIEKDIDAKYPNGMYVDTTQAQENSAGSFIETYMEYTAGLMEGSISVEEYEAFLDTLSEDEYAEVKKDIDAKFPNGVYSTTPQVQESSTSSSSDEQLPSLNTPFSL